MTTVKHFHSALTGAPVLNGVAGSLIAILDACLVDGWGLKVVDSVAVSGGKATLSVSTGHAFDQDLIVLVAGAAQTGLNGEKRIESRTPNTAVFDAAGIADGADSGTITVKIAPAGWQKVYSGTNLAVYRSQDATGTRMFLRVDDTGATNARVVGYEAMTGISAGSGPFPTAGQISGGGYWPKASDTSATSRYWTVVANSKTFWLHAHTTPNNQGLSGAVWGFGDIAALKSGDPYACALWSHSSDIASVGGGTSITQVEWESNGGAASPYAPRSFTGLGGSVQLLASPESYWSGSGVSGAASSISAPAYPNSPNNGLFFTRKLLTESGVAQRGSVVGCLSTPQNCHGSFTQRQKVNGSGAFAGRKLLAVKCGAPAGAASQGVIFFDITGPWG